MSSFDNIDDNDHEIVSVSDKPFPSLPLFLPSDVEYDSHTNTVVPKNKENADPHTAPELLLVPNAGVEMLANLQPTNTPLSMIACVGPYRTGKSLLVSRFLQTSKAFQIGPTLEGCTRGIWISTSALKQKSTGVYKFLLDCEGMGDPLASGGSAQATAQYDARIALACLLLSTVFVFNNTSHPDRGALQFLNYLHTIRQRIPKSQTQHMKYPSFVWVFRDFFLQLPSRPDNPAQRYTLQEYMLERVLLPTTTTSPKAAGGNDNTNESQVVVDSLLNDFSNFFVGSIGYPKQKEGVPFGVEEMSMLGEVPWEYFDTTFQQEMHAVIQQCLEQASTPFSMGQDLDNTKPQQDQGGFFPWRSRASNSPFSKLGPYASPAVYAKWCETCLTLVNSEGVIPNLPDLQQQLLQNMADEMVQQSIAKYQTILQEFLDASDVYNDKANLTTPSIPVGNELDLLKDLELKELVQQKQLQGIAEADTLEAISLHTSEKLKDELAEAIQSPSILEDAIQVFSSKCDNAKGTVWSQLQQENERRSKVACEALAQRLYAPLRQALHADPTRVSVGEFSTRILIDVERVFRAWARGPAVEATLQQHLVEPGETDVIFLAKVQERQGKLDQALEIQATLEKDIQEKRQNLVSLEQNLKETQEKNEIELQEMKEAHTKAMQEAMEQQQKEQEEQLVKLEQELKSKLNQAETTLQEKEEQRLKELEALREESEKRFHMEVEVRENRRKEELEAYEKELERIKAASKNELQEEMQLAAEQRRAEQERIQNEMEAKLAEAKRQMEEEMQKKQQVLAEAEQAIAQKERENQTLLERAEKAESQSCPNMCCCM